MKSCRFFLKHLPSFLLLALIFGRSLPAFAAADEEHRFEGAIQSIKSRGVSCFISHAWEGSNPNPLVSRLERHLDSAGIVTYFDNRDDERGAKDGIPSFMNNIAETDCVLMVFTPTFKDKYKKKSNVATEVNYVISSLLNPYPEKIVPVLFSGTQDTAIPPLLKPLRYYDFTNTSIYQDQFFKVLGHMLPSQASELAGLRNSLMMSRTAQIAQRVIAPPGEKAVPQPTASKPSSISPVKEERKEESKSTSKPLEGKIIAPPPPSTAIVAAKAPPPAMSFG